MEDLPENQNEKEIQESEKIVEKQSLETQKASAEKAKASFFDSISNIFVYFRELLNLQIGADKQATITRIKGDIEFKGATIWILICSIFIASIGLNVNSTAVIIGAMLISPLMGPILGIGLSLGTYDWDTLKLSLKSLGVATFFSILTAFIFFLISPIKEITPELSARTEPNLYDAFIGIFGGLAGIIALSRKEKTNVIPGVAIATALMPPLCTAGYGLARGDFDIFLGAFYLFFLNSFFICIATFIIVRLLKIPVREFLDPKREQTVKRSIAFFTLLILIPSAFIFVNITKKLRFETSANEFIAENIVFDDTKIAKANVVYGDSISEISVVLFGNHVPKSVINLWENKLKKTDYLEQTQLKIIQNDDVSGDFEMMKEEMMQDVYQNTLDELKLKRAEVKELNSALTKQQDSEIVLKDVLAELKELHPEVSHISIGQHIENQEQDINDQVFVAFSLEPEYFRKIENEKENIVDYLKVRLKKEHVQLILQPTVEFQFESELKTKTEAELTDTNLISD